MKILVLGAGGMAGHVVATYLREQGHSIDTLSANNKLDESTVLLDVTDNKVLDDYLNSKTYDIIINCIGLLVKPSEDQKDLAVLLNSYLPHYLEKKYEDSSTRVIHLSTDCVFSGENAPYFENSLHDGALFYDRSKSLGEIINEKDLTFRMSIIGPDMSPKGIGLFNWFYSQTGEISGYTKAFWNGITTIELARGIQEAITNNLTGLYHLVPAKGDNISKFELLKLFKNEFNRNDLEIKPSDNVAQDKTLVNTRTDFDFTVSSYPQMIKEMHEWISNHKSLYSHYNITLLGESK